MGSTTVPTRDPKAVSIPSPFSVSPPALVCFESPDRALWPISVALYLEMVRTGVLGEHIRAYLWKGQLVAPKVPQRPHSISVRRSSDKLDALIPPDTHVERGQPMAFRYAASVPEPDVVVLRGDVQDYPDAFPTTGDMLLVLEVADHTSLNIDRRMADDYAAEGVASYWLVNIAERCVEVHSDPRPAAYATKRTFQPGESIPLVLDGKEVATIAVEALLP